MVMNSDVRHPKEFSTENTLGGDSVFPEDRRRLCLDAAIRPGLCATKPLAALFGSQCNRLRSSKPGRQFMRIETDCSSYSKGWKSTVCRHLVDMLGRDLERFCQVARVKCGFLFPIGNEARSTNSILGPKPVFDSDLWLSTATVFSVCMGARYAAI